MKNRWKRLTSICLALALTATTAAMGGCQPGETQSTPPQSSNPEESKTSEASGFQTDELIELRWLSSQIGESAESGWFSKVVEGFNKEYEGKIKINVDGVAGEAANDKLKSDAATGTMPDLYMLSADAARFNLIANSGHGVDLMPYMEKNADLWDKVDKDSAAAYTDKDGHLLGLPYAKSYIGIYYNTKLTADAGITEMPKTWDEFFAACDKLKAKGVAPVTMMTGENSWTTMLILSHLLGATPDGVKWLQYKPETVKFNEPAFIAAAEKLQRILKDYTTADAVGATYAVAENNFLNEKTAIVSNGPWMIANFSSDKAAEGLDKNIKFALAPESGVIQSENISYGIGSSDPKKAEAAFEVLKYLARPEVYAEFLNVSANSPCIELDTSLLELDPINKEFLPQALDSQNKYGQFSNCVKAAVTDGLGQLLPDLANGSMTPEQFATKLQEISDKN